MSQQVQKKTEVEIEVLEYIKQRTSVSESGCWDWVGALSKGYGQLTFKGKHQTAHRFAYANLVEPIKPGLWVLHHCDNRKCVNPKHLYQGTPVDNRADMLNRNRWSHPYGKKDACFRGHKYEEGEFRIASDGSRACRICNREYKRAYRELNKGK